MLGLWESGELHAFSTFSFRVSCQGAGSEEIDKLYKMSVKIANRVFEATACDAEIRSRLKHLALSLYLSSIADVLLNGHLRGPPEQEVLLFIFFGQKSFHHW